jgi:hypothetical protein
VKDLEERFLTKPHDYDFYFRIGSGLSCFGTGYQVGKGKIYRFKDLPTAQNIRSFFPLIGSAKPSTTEQTERRLENERFLHYRIKSIGTYRAREKAILELKRSISILKLIYKWQTSYSVESTSPP